MRMLKLAGFAAHRTKLGDKSAVALENLGKSRFGKPGKGGKNTLDQMKDLVKDEILSRTMLKV